MMLPSKSGRKAVRQRNAGSIAALARAYGVLLSAWIGARSAEKVAGATQRAWTAVFRARLLALAEEIHTIRELTGLAKWEGSIRGKWPSAEYTRLVNVQAEMIVSLGQVRFFMHAYSTPP
jgi:hypothetical protein